MNFNIYVDDTLAESLQRTAKALGKSRNAIIREAILDWMAQHENTAWPPEVIAFEGDDTFEPFEAHRDELEQPLDDPFA